MKAIRADLGDQRRLEVETGIDGVPTDPDLVILDIIDPEGNSFSFNTVDGDVQQSGTGSFYYDLTLGTSGTWSWRYSAQGVVTGVDTGEIFVPETVWG